MTRTRLSWSPAALSRRAAGRNVRSAAAAGRASGRARRLPHAPAGRVLCEQHAAGAGSGHRCATARALSLDPDALHVTLPAVAAHGARASFFFALGRTLLLLKPAMAP